jgi:hypothetical protein
MDGSFACPECGSEVQIAGLAPGRQVRCEFCHRLVEVPFLPRVPVGRRRRFGRSWWARWAWRAIGAAAAVALILAAIRFVGRQYVSMQEESILKLAAKSRDHEAEGRLDLALVDLDAAIDLANRSGAPAGFAIDREREYRADLARREAEGALDQLLRPETQPFPTGQWLNLVARVGKDPDLSPLKSRVETAFGDALRRRVAAELATAQREFGRGEVLASLRACDRVAALLAHMRADAAEPVRREAAEVVTRLVERHGVALEVPRGEYVFGSDQSYRERLVPVLQDALEARGYLPYRASSPWKLAWRDAKYLMTLRVAERLYGNYLLSENRLTRIEARLVLTVRSSGAIVWQTSPSATTTAPVPRLPAYVSARVAASPERSEEFERMLYDDARGQIDGKFGQALSNMPAWRP